MRDSTPSPCFLVAPMERHVFTHGPRSDWRCHLCGRPRAMHVDDGFVAGNLASRLSQDPGANYRGPHPRFTRPGMVMRPDRREWREGLRKAAAKGLVPVLCSTDVPRKG